MTSCSAFKHVLIFYTSIIFYSEKHCLNPTYNYYSVIDNKLQFSPTFDTLILARFFVSSFFMVS